LQSENDQLKQQLRKFQYDPPNQQGDAELQERLEQAAFDIESLKLLVNELKQENDELRGNNSVETEPYPTETDRMKFLAKMKRYEEESPTSPSSSKQSNRQPPQSSSSPFSQSQNIRKLSFSTNISESIPFFERKEMLDKELEQLTLRKSPVLIDSFR
jgi:hypothetical protein